MHNKLQSVYSNHIKQLIELKRKLGFKFKVGSYYLTRIDRFASERSEVSLGITKEFADKWAEKILNETEANRYVRITHLAQFSSYLNRAGIASFIPKLPPYKESQFIPYIYSPSEIEDIMRASDGLRPEVLNTTTSLFSVPALIRLLYCTGIRISEALSLKLGDVNLDYNYLLIKDVKNQKERIIPISDSLASVCKSHSFYRDKLPLNKRTDYFFVNLEGNKCTRNSVQKWFKQCQDKAGVKTAFKNKRPRIHDLRHTFAVTSLAKMADAGVDLYASLPILSNYLGHQSLEATNHYVRLTATMFPQLIKEVDIICLDVFPKFKNYETN